MIERKTKTRFGKLREIHILSRGQLRRHSKYDPITRMWVHYYFDNDGHLTSQKADYGHDSRGLVGMGHLVFLRTSAS